MFIQLKSRRNLLLIIFLFTFFRSFSQIDTTGFIRNIIIKHTQFNNLSVEFLKNGGIQHPEVWMLKKVWIIKNQETIQKMRVETKFLNQEQSSTLHIINSKQQLSLNSTFKRSDVYFFNLLKEEQLNEYFHKLEDEHLPSFMINEGNVDELTNEMYEYIKNSGNISLKILKDSIINGIPCFGIQITDIDKNNGYIPDKTEINNEKYADKTIESNYLRKSDSLLLLRKTDYIYENPINKISQVEKIVRYQINCKENENTQLYCINTDTLREYFQTKTRFNGAENETTLSDFSIKIGPSFSEKTIQGNNLDIKMLKSKMILLVFWAFDDENCILHLNTLNSQYEDLKAFGLEIIAINASDLLTDELHQYLSKKTFRFPVIFSEEIGRKYLIRDASCCFLLDKDLKIKDIFYNLNQNKIDKIMKILK